MAKRIIRRLTAEEKARHEAIRAEMKREFPPAKKKRLQPVCIGIAARVRQARKEQGLTYFAVAKKSGIPNSTTIKEVEYGRDARLSNIEAIAGALGLKLKLVEDS